MIGVITGGLSGSLDSDGREGTSCTNSHCGHFA
jgi:hypothetical protein